MIRIVYTQFPIYIYNINYQIISLSPFIKILMQQNRNNYKPKNQQHRKYKQKYLHLIYTHPKWTTHIKPDLQKLADKVLNAKQIIQKLGQFDYFSTTVRTNQKKDSSSFNQLYQQYKQQLPSIYSNIANLILHYQTKPPQFPILYSRTAAEYTFNKQQMLLLMSMMSSGLILDQEFRQHYRFPYWTDFKYIFSNQNYKTKGIIQYLKKQFKTRQQSGNQYLQQKLTLKRIVKDYTIAQAIKAHSNKPMLIPKIAEDTQSIQQYYGQVKVDFANKYIGGGALHTGCVQEEIMFANHPQMFTSVLFCEVMRQNQAIQFIGYKKYIKNQGYGYTASYAGQENHKYQYDQNNRAKEYIVGIDALHYLSSRSREQFQKQTIDRQLMKAYVGFAGSGTQNSKIVTGNWGCGAFKGDIPLKFFIQWLAAAMVGKQLIYVPFGQRKKLQNKKIYQIVSKMNVQQFYKLLNQNNEQLQNSRNVYDYLKAKLQGHGNL